MVTRKIEPGLFSRYPGVASCQSTGRLPGLTLSFLHSSPILRLHVSVRGASSIKRQTSGCGVVLDILAANMDVLRPWR